VPQTLMGLCLPSRAGGDRRSLPLVSVGGAPALRATAGASESSRLAVHEGYGVSEASFRSWLSTGRRQKKPGSVGRPAHVELRFAIDGKSWSRDRSRKAISAPNERS